MVYLSSREAGASGGVDWSLSLRELCICQPARVGVAACVAFGQKSSWPPGEMPITKGKIIRVGGQSKGGREGSEQGAWGSQGSYREMFYV